MLGCVVAQLESAGHVLSCFEEDHLLTETKQGFKAIK